MKKYYPYFLTFIIWFSFSYLYENQIKPMTPAKCMQAITNFCHEHWLPKYMCESWVNIWNPVYDE